MKLTREHFVRGSVLLGIGLIAALWLGRLHYWAPAATASASPEQPHSWVQLGANPAVSLDGTTFRVTGPYKHENLAIYLLHSADQDATEFITLEEGLRSGIVKVTEKDQERVNELMIENTGAQPLFLQEGERIQGGKQDRIIYASHVIPPHSGKMPVSSFCVEQGRWGTGAAGKSFHGNENVVLASRRVRTAAKVHKDQGAVWGVVAGQKAVVARSGLASNSNTSLNETLDSPKVKQLSEAFTAALKDVLDRQADAKGIAIAINGRILEINDYPNHQVLTKLYPRLLGSYALEAVMYKEAAANTRTPQAADVCAYMWQSTQSGEQRQTTITIDQVQMASSRVHTRLSGGLAGPGNTNQPAQPEQVRRDAEEIRRRVDEFRRVLAEQRQVVQFSSGGSPSPEELRAVQRRLEEVRRQLTDQDFASGQAMPVEPATAQRQEALNKDNRLKVVEAANAYLCTTRYNGKLVHRQFLPRENTAPAAAQPNRAVPQRGQVELVY
jgi:hypothetical protein